MLQSKLSACVLRAIVLFATLSAAPGASALESLITCKPGGQGAPLPKVQVLRGEAGEIKTLIVTAEGLEFWEKSNALEWHMKNITLPNLENKAYRLRLSGEESQWTLVEYTIDNLEYYYEMVCQGARK